MIFIFCLFFEIKISKNFIFDQNYSALNFALIFFNESNCFYSTCLTFNFADRTVKRSIEAEKSIGWKTFPRIPHF